MGKLFLYLLILGILLLGTFPAQSQHNIKDSSIFTPLISFNYAFQLPGGDLSERFGANSNLGFSANFKLKSQWMIGLDYNFMFGNRVKEYGILDSLRTDNGYIINNNGQPAQILLFERGHAVYLTFGRLFPVWGPNPNSGIFAKIGVGYLQHKIRIEHNNDNVPPLNGDYKKGYDRLTSGLMVNQFIGYQYLSNSRLLNFYAGLDFQQAFTQNRRSYNFDTMEQDTSERLDLLFGIRVGWIIPIYKRAPKDFNHRQ